MAANPVLVSNKVLYEPQPITYPTKSCTGTIVFANEFSGVNVIPMPQEWRDIFNNDYGETGNNIIVQLQQKVQQKLEGGPWYVDSINGTIYIHNRKFNEPVTAEYNYQAENGELLMASFETQYITRNIQGSSALSIDSLKKTWQAEMIDESNMFTTGVDEVKEDDKLEVDAMSGDAVRANAKKKPVYHDSNYDRTAWDAEDANHLLSDFMANKVEFEYVSQINTDVHSLTGKWAFSDPQWQLIMKHRDWQLMNKVKADPYDSYNYWAEKNLASSDLTPDIAKMVWMVSGGREDEYKDRMNRLYLAALNGTLDEEAKRYSEVKYTFDSRKYRIFGIVHEGVKTPRWVVNDKTDPSVAHNEDVRSGVKDDWRPTLGYVSYTTSGYNLIMGIGSRKPGGKDRITSAMLNNHKKVTEKKLVAKCLVVGRPHLASSQVIFLNNVGKRWSKRWYIKTCVHKLDHSTGYTTEMELVQNEADLHPSASRFEGGISITGDGVGEGVVGEGAGGKVIKIDGKAIYLNSSEVELYNAVSDEEKVNMLILKMDGVEDVVQFGGNVNGNLSKDSDIHKHVKKPTQEQMDKYGNRARSVINSINKARSDGERSEKIRRNKKLIETSWFKSNILPDGMWIPSPFGAGFTLVKTKVDENGDITVE